MNPTKQDVLKSMFSHVPEEVLPPTFHAEMMQRIRKEALRISKRNKLLRLLALIAASAATIGLAAASLIYLGIPHIEIEIPQISFPPYYLYFGAIVLILLVADHLFRQFYDKKHRIEDRKDGRKVGICDFF